MNSAEQHMMVAPGPADPPASDGIDWQRIVRMSGRWVGTIVAVILVALMLITAVDVIGRYFLSRPLPGALELTVMLLAALLSTSLPSVILRGENVAIDLFDKVFEHPLANSPAAGLCRRDRHRLLRLPDLAPLVLAQQVRVAAETTATLNLPVYPVAYLITVMVGVATIAAGLIAIGFVRQLD